ncbi:hypothetical protein [Hoeflea alexandrii]|uniref:hypothetical protein n=1 Tax=Hoeflea alexandrii TaxID=288436 RepID=UPI0022AFE84A|nr:hypothetical protein [Hoeflea alexandrii]MCZ4289934.1 hypothetical protein [Hoeflea alexandrii]
MEIKKNWTYWNSALSAQCEKRWSGNSKDTKTKVLVNSLGERWTPTGFRASWRKEMARLKITGVTFHDLGGTGISWLHRVAKLPIADIAAISGHSADEAEAIIRHHHLASEAVASAWDQFKT